VIVLSVFDIFITSRAIKRDNQPHLHYLLYRLQALDRHYLQEQNIPSTFTEDKREYGSEDAFGFLGLTSKIDKVNFLHYIYDDSQIYLQRKYLLAQRFIELVSTGKKCWTLKK